MKNIYLRSKNSLNNIIISQFLAVLPLIIFGFYKNGIKIYLKGLASVNGLILPLLFDVIGLLIGCLVNIIYEKINKKSTSSIREIIFSSFHPFYGLLVASIISINTNLLLFILVTFVVFYISKFLKETNINIMALTALIIIFIIDIFGDFTFLNSYEISHNLNLVSIDYIVGKGSGGINTTCVALLLFSLIILCNKEYYKKEIPLYSSIVYSGCIIIYAIITSSVGNTLDNIFANGILFSFIFIAPDLETSCYTKKGKVIYSLIIGLTTFGLFLVYPPLSALGGIIIASLCHRTIDKLCQKV